MVARSRSNSNAGRVNQSFTSQNLSFYADNRQSPAGRITAVSANQPVRPNSRGSWAMSAIPDVTDDDSRVEEVKVSTTRDDKKLRLFYNEYCEAVR